MWTSVRSFWMAFNAPIEGEKTWMYLDIKGLVTTGLGQLIDPEPLALALPWLGSDGAPAPSDAVSAAWRAVKADVGLAHAGAAAAENVTTVRLSSDSVQALALETLDRYESILKAWAPFSAWDGWPADAQLAVLSMSWALGPGFPGTWPHFSADCEAANWTQAAQDCWIIDSGNAGLRVRNVANRAALNLAAQPGEPSALRSKIPG